MEVISLILSGLALLVAVVNLFLFFWEKKRGAKRYEALLKYIDTADELAMDKANKFVWECMEKQWADYEGLLETFDKKITACFDEHLKNFDGTVNGCVKSIEKRLSDLEGGVCPDYNAALAAKESVDRFSEGIMNILCYGNPTTPMEKKEMDKEDKE